MRGRKRRFHANYLMTAGLAGVCSSWMGRIRMRGRWLCVLALLEQTHDHLTVVRLPTVVYEGDGQCGDVVMYMNAWFACAVGVFCRAVVQ